MKPSDAVSILLLPSLHLCSKHEYDMKSAANRANQRYAISYLIVNSNHGRIT